MDTKRAATTSESQTAPVAGDKTEGQKTLDQVAAHQALFASMAFQMSWQLAVVVLVPLLGGYMLDERLHTLPWLTFVGLAIAALGTIGILMRVVREADSRSSDLHTPKGQA